MKTKLSLEEVLKLEKEIYLKKLEALDRFNLKELYLLKQDCMKRYSETRVFE